jgi:hypothetical protein
MLTVFDGLATKVVADGLLHRSPSLGSHYGLPKVLGEKVGDYFGDVDKDW